MFGLLRFFDELISDGPAEHDDESLALAAAALMMEVSRADAASADIELETIMPILVSQFDVSPDTVSSLVAAASERVEAANDLYQFTAIIDAQLNYQAKARLVKAMWLVAFADGRIEAIEDHIIRRVAGLLNVAHEDFIRAKISARDASGAGR